MEQGDLYILPKDEDPRGDPKDRVHLALSLLNPRTDLISFAFCSTSDYEASQGAPAVHIDRNSATFPTTGLSESTFVYPSRLVTEEYLRLPSRIGRVLDEMPAIRDSLRSALGIGLGTAHTSGAALGSLRGQILQLGSRVAADLETSYALVTASPRYSLRHRYLNIVPIYDAAEYEESDVDVITTPGDWASGLALPSQILFCVSAICSCFAAEPTHVAAQLARVVDEETMRRVDEKLLDHFFDESDR